MDLFFRMFSQILLEKMQWGPNSEWPNTRIIRMPNKPQYTTGMLAKQNVRFLMPLENHTFYSKKVWFLNLLASKIQSIWQSDTLLPYKYRKCSVFGYPLYKHFIYNNITLLICQGIFITFKFTVKVFEEIKANLHSKVT